jgi:hypothetical protein
MNGYELIPGSVAALLYVRPPAWAEFSGASISCVYASKERGVLVGRFEKPLAEMGWPAEVQAQINKHFGTVFSLEHENWKGKGPSPRAQYCDAAVPWTVEVSA